MQDHVASENFCTSIVAVPWSSTKVSHATSSTGVNITVVIIDSQRHDLGSKSPYDCGLQ